MSRQSLRSSEHDSDNRSRRNDSPASGADPKGNHQEFGYASQINCPRTAPQLATNGSTVLLDQPIPEHPYALLPQRVEWTNRNLLLGQAGYDAGLQYPCQINNWNDTAFNFNQLGESTFGTVSYDASLNLSNGGLDVGLDPQLAPTWVSDNTYGYDQPMMPTMHRAPPVPAFYSTPAPAGLTAPTTTTNAGPICCPKGCSETFGRGEELRRHMKKHETPRYKCPIYDCPMTFYRKDKLRDHTQKGHKGRDSLNIR